MSERTYKLLDGSELICTEEGVLAHRLQPGFTPITTDPNAEYMNLLSLIDSLQEQLAEAKEREKSVLGIIKHASTELLLAEDSGEATDRIGERLQHLAEFLEKG
jgi:hypothetical protein